MWARDLLRRKEGRGCLRAGRPEVMMRLCGVACLCPLLFLLSGVESTPVFSGGDSQAAAVFEDASTGVTVTSLSVYDPDDSSYTGPSNGDVTITSGTVPFSVAIEGYTVSLVVAGALDRETTDSYAITLELQPGGDTVTVTVTVLDVNDEPPTWVFPPESNPNFGTFTYREDEAVVGMEIETLIATDRDQGSGGTVEFILEEPVHGPFAIGLQTGVITLQRSLDYDEADTYDIRVIVQDEGNPPLVSSTTATATVAVLEQVTAVSAPVWSQSVYSVEIQEDNYTASSLTILTARVTDPDNDPSTEYQFTKPTRGDESDTLFTIRDIGSGDVAVDVVGVINYELQDRHTFNIEVCKLNAMSVCINGTTAITTVVVTVTDTNDHPPRFFSSHYSASIRENANIGDIVIATIEAYDLDEGTNGEFQYAFADPLTTVPFAIDAHTAVITVNGPLDYDVGATGQLYEFMIEVTETDAVPALSTSATVTIIVLNINDHGPMFPATPTQYEYSVTENTAGAALTTQGGVTDIVATDDDLGAFGEVTYSLSGIGVGTLFDVSATGQLSTLTSLDREESASYHLTLFATDGGMPALQDTTELLVNVEDVNDEPPVFGVSTHVVELIEGQDYSDFITFQATDADATSPNNQVTYPTITRTDSTDPNDHPFTLDSSSGTISVLSSGLNHTIADSYELRITARDGGTPHMESFATLSVTVLPQNEQGPVFQGAPYSASITEDHATGNPIGVTAVARDLIEGHSVEYRIDPSSQDGAYFRIGVTSGEITLGLSLDADPPNGHTLFTFNVIAEDQPGGGLQNARLSATAQVIVTVTDVNDNSPIITNPPVHDPFSYEIVEAVALVPRELLVIEASDIDGDSDGSSLVYTLSGGSTLFELDMATGSLKQVAQLDRESSSSHILTVVASDQGTMPRSSSVEITITVTDYNDNPPVMSQPLTSTVSITECTVRGELLGTVHATDSVDTGDNAEVVFEVISGDIGYIILNTVTGDLTLGGTALDYEGGDRSFTLTVGAIDNPDGTDQLQSMDQFVLTLLVEDCNDEPPVFSLPEYDFSITERTSASSGTETIFTNISTSDDDGTPLNQAVTYSLADGLSSTLNWLDIDPSTGAIFIRDGELVDRENSNLLTDSSGRGVLSFNVIAVNTAPTASFTSPAQVTVRIEDVNDNPPVISSTSGPTSLSLLESTPTGTILSVLSATDMDVGDNAHIRYDITSGNDAGKFSVNPDTGVLSLTGQLDSESGDSSFTLVVTASNDLTTGPSTDMITITVTVVGSNEHAPVFDTDHYQTSIVEHDDLLNTSNPSSVITVHATDRDNDPIEYTITGGNGQGIFDIPIPESGSVEIVRPDIVDYETTKFFTLIITATDVIVPDSLRRTNTTYLNISVTDVNDNVPQFTSTMYYGSVAEEQDGGTSVTLTSAILANDADQNGIEPLVFEATTVGSPFPAFSLSSDGSLLTTTTAIDRETQGDSFSVEIRVTDTGGHTDTATVFVDIIDINDNPPVIQETSQQLFLTIPENHAVGSVIASITAQDDDIGLNANFTFSLSGGAGYFEMNHRTGIVTLVASLQALEPPMMFDLTAYARDTGSLETSVTFTVNLTYSNDHMPIFNPPLYFGSILECTDNGTDIGITISATDADSNARVSYYVVSSSVGDLFRVDPRPGEVADILAYGEGLFDRETDDSLTFTVAATDSTLGTDDDFATVTITLTDCNDNYPIFTQDFYEVDVFENTFSQVTVIQVHTSDADIGTNADVRYFLRGVDPPELTGVFRVDEETGGVVTNQEITSDLTGTSTCSGLVSNNVTLTIEAIDQGMTPLANETVLFIRLLDRNFDAPSFQPSNFYNFSVLENVNDTVVGTVLATDLCDVGSQVTYTIVDGADSDSFRIDEDQGHIRLVTPLDREMNNLLVVLLEATDDGTDPGPRTGYASVSVHVLDVNDNRPVLLQDTFIVSKPENTPPSTTLATVTASDADLGENSRLSYSMISGNTTVFSLETDSNNGYLVTLVELDREEMASYVVEVLVEDGGQPRLNDTATVSLTITDINDNLPVWVSGNGTTFSILENITNILVVDLDATDRDEGVNRELAYFFVGNVQDEGPFHIDRSNGTLYLTGQLDYEATTQYSLNVIVADRNGMEDNDMLQALTTITVNVVDINDEKPYFTICPFTFTIPEDLPQGSTIGDGMISAVNDLDTIDNPFYFYLVDVEDVVCNDVFCVNSSTGQITLQGDIDYETQTSHELYVLVSDRAGLTPQEAYMSPPIDLCRTVATQRNRITMVTVNLEDVNDNAPVFVEDSLLAAVAEEAEFDTTVTVLQAQDQDSNTNFSTIFYEILSINPPYVVDRDTGVVVTAGIFRGRSGQRDTYTVRAYDNRGEPPSRSSTAILSIQIFKETEQVILVLDRKKDDAEACTEQIRGVVANVTGNIIHITKIRVHQEQGGETVDTAQSDLIFFALDRSTGEVVDPNEIIRIIDQNYDAVEDVFEMCDVLFVSVNSGGITGSSSDDSVPIGVWIALGILGGIIILLLICLLCVFVLERRKNKKLKLKKKSHHESSQFSQLSQVDYAAVNNPIWIPPYDQWEEESTTTAAHSSVPLERENPIYESQELTIEMFQDDEDDALSRASSKGYLHPPPTSSTPGARESTYSYDDDLLAEIVGEKKGFDSETSLI